MAKPFCPMADCLCSHSDHRLPYAKYFGGVSALSKEQVEKVNGNSNLYFGWGCEDDDLYYR